ncbi:MAG TPA: hypothetical protein VGK35_15295, partial [Actinotalea sp.]
AAKSRRAASLRTAATGRRRRGVLATTAVLVVAAGALLVGQLSNDGTSTPAPPPQYPAVTGPIGDALHDLQTSVEP